MSTKPREQPDVSHCRWLIRTLGICLFTLFLDDYIGDFFFLIFLLLFDELRVLREGHELLPVVRLYDDVLLLRLKAIV